jgi:hypothetical protein
MIYYINHAPAWVILILFAMVSIGLMLILHKIFRAMLDKFAPGYKADLALNIHNSVSTLLALIVAFSFCVDFSLFERHNPLHPHCHWFHLHL